MSVQKLSAQPNQTNQMRGARMIQNNQDMEVNTSTPYINEFRIQDNKIQLVRHTRFSPFYTQVLLKNKIVKNQVSQFSFKVLESYYKGQDQRCAIFIGITRQQYALQRNSQWHKDVFSYLGKKALTFPTKFQQGKGFKLYDIITVKVDRVNMKIEWIVNGKIEASLMNGHLKQGNYVPFVQMNEENDMVQWLGFKSYQS